MNSLEYERDEVLLGVRMKIAILCAQGKAFIGSVLRHLEEAHEIRFQDGDGLTVRGLFELMSWSDISFFEWCDDILLNATLKLPKVCKVVCRIHGHEVFTKIPGLIEWEKVDDLIIVSEYFKRLLILSIPGIETKTNIHVIHNGVDLERFHFRERQKGYNLAVVGLYNLRKNPSLLLQCFKRLIVLDPRYRLHICRLGEETSYSRIYLEYLIHQMGLDGCIEREEGWVDDVDGWLEDKEYIVSTSIAESFHCTIAEGMAKGIKPIIHNWPGAMEFWPKEYIFNDTDEFIAMVTSNRYDSQRYRRYIEENFPLTKQLEAIDRVLFG